MATAVKTKVGELKYVFIKGEGRNQAMPGEEARYQYVASIVFKKDSPEHKYLKALIDEEWKEYKTSNSVKGLPATTGIKDEMQKDPKGEIDPATEEVRKVPTGNIIAQFKTNTTWPNGNPKIVKVFDHKGAEITGLYAGAQWAIGEGSTGVIFGTASGNGIGGKHKVTLYLNAVQIAKLKKYEGVVIETEELDGDDIELDVDVSDDEIPF